VSRYENRSVGILALQGDYERHQHQLKMLDVPNLLVRLPADLDRVDSLIVPGGETTTMDILLDRFGLREPLKRFGRSKPIFGTCAGMVMLASRIEDNLSEVTPLRFMDIDVIRNGYGRQIHSFADEVTASLNGRPSKLDAIFIRAPRITRIGKDVTVLASYRGDPVLVQQENFLACSFHTELEEDLSLLKFFLNASGQSVTGKVQDL